TSETGITALAGLTLLECGVPDTDDAVKKAATRVRDACPALTHTYSVALSILFFDRLGDPADVPLIESLTVRLLAGQSADGGWTYDCPSISDAEMKRLMDLINKRIELTTRPEKPKDDDGENKRSVKDLPDEIRQQLDLIARNGPIPVGGGVGV